MKRSILIISLVLSGCIQVPSGVDRRQYLADYQDCNLKVRVTPGAGNTGIGLVGITGAVLGQGTLEDAIGRCLVAKGYSPT